MNPSRSQSNPTPHKAIQAQPKTIQAQAQPKAIQAQAQPKAIQAQAQPKTIQAQAQPKTIQAQSNQPNPSSIKPSHQAKSNQSYPIEKKKNLLISSMNNQFFKEIVTILQKDYNVEIDLFHEINEKDRQKMLERADVIFCEWCQVNALWYSHNKKKTQKLYIRLHRHELWTSVFYDIGWRNVNNLIFISPEIKRLANKNFIQRQHVNENNFDWEFYLNNNNKMFDKLPKDNYNKTWAFDHWNSVGRILNWQNPHINLTDATIDYNKSCDEFKHFDGGTLILNYVKSNMFKFLPKNVDNHFNIGIMGVIPKLKRLDIAIDILENMLQKDKRYKLHVLSKRHTDADCIKRTAKELDYYNNINERIKKSNLTEHVIFEKHTPSPEEWFQKIGYLLSVSDIEGSHQAVAEAMACGTIPFIYGKALHTYKLDEIYPQKFCFYEDTVDNLCDKMHAYQNNTEIEIIRNECKGYSFVEFNLNKIYYAIKSILLNEVKVESSTV